MESFKERIQKEAAVEKISVGDLTPEREYGIETLRRTTTQYGPCVIAVMKAAEEDRWVEVFLPKAVTISDGEINDFNAGLNKNLIFIFLGRLGQKFKYKFK